MLFESIINSSIGKWVSSTAGNVSSSVSSFFTEPDLFGDDADSMDSGIASFGSGIANSSFAKFAKAGYSYFQEQRKGINNQTVSGKRVRAPRDAALPGMKQASRTNLGDVPRVRAGGASAQQAAQGSPIQATIAQIAYRQSRSPLITLDKGTQISIKPRAKKNAT